jgi:hypothetical protein
MMTPPSGTPLNTALVLPPGTWPEAAVSPGVPAAFAFSQNRFFKWVRNGAPVGHACQFFGEKKRGGVYITIP